MARRPGRTRLECYVSWRKKVRGHRILPLVTRQAVEDFCGAQAAVESFESRARILNAIVDLPFPTLSIQHLIDMIRDDEMNAPTLAEKQRVKEAEYAFDLLKTKGVVSEEDYDAAPASEHGFTKNVQGLKHYELEGYEVCYLKDNPLADKTQKKKMIPLAVDQITSDGPVYAWLASDDAFMDAAHGIYRAPETNQLKSGRGRLLTHALILYGFGGRGRRTSVFLFQNNWGVEQHVGGRGILETKAIMGIIVPYVVRNWNN